MRQADTEHRMGSWHRGRGHRAAGFARLQAPTAPFSGSYHAKKAVSPKTQTTACLCFSPSPSAGRAAGLCEPAARPGPLKRPPDVCGTLGLTPEVNSR